MMAITAGSADFPSRYNKTSAITNSGNDLHISMMRRNINTVVLLLIKLRLEKILKKKASNVPIAVENRAILIVLIKSGRYSSNNKFHL